MRQIMANFDRINKLNETHASEQQQLMDKHAADVKARELELKCRHEANLAKAIAQTEQRVRGEVKAELEVARRAKIAIDEHRIKVDILQRNAVLLKKELRQTQSSAQNHVDFGSARREAELKAEISTLQTKLRELTKKAASTNEVLRVCNASKTGSEKQQCANEANTVSKVEVDRLNAKIRELEEMLRSATRRCNGECQASQARIDELRFVIRNNREQFDRGKQHKNKQHRQVTERLEREKAALQKEKEDLQKQLADQQRPATVQALNLSQIYTIISQDPDPLPTSSLPSKFELIPSNTNATVNEAVVDKSPTKPSTSQLPPNTHEALKATKTHSAHDTTSKDAEVSTENNQTPAEGETIVGPVAEGDPTTTDATMKDSQVIEPTSTSPVPLSTNIAGPDGDVLPDAGPHNPPIEVDESMEESTLPANQAEQARPVEQATWFGGFGGPYGPSTAFNPAGVGEQSGNAMAYDFTGPGQISGDAATYDLAQILKQLSTPSQPNTAPSGSIPQDDQPSEPMAISPTPALPTAPIQGQEPVSFPSIPCPPTADTGAQPSQAANDQVDQSTAPAPTSEDNSAIEASKNLALLLAKHGVTPVSSVQTSSSTTPHQDPTSIAPIDSSLLPNGVTDQPEPQLSPRKIHALRPRRRPLPEGVNNPPATPPVTPARNVAAIPRRLRRPTNLKPFEYNKDAGRDPPLPKPHVTENLPLVVDLPDGGFSGSASHPSQSQPPPPPSPPKFRIGAPVKRSPARTYGSSKYGSIFDDPLFFDKPNDDDDDDFADFEDVEGFQRQPQILDAPTDLSENDNENDDFYGHDDDSKNQNGDPSSSQQPSDPASSHHPSTSVEPPRGVDHSGEGEKRGADGSAGRGEVDSRSSSSLSSPNWSSDEDSAEGVKQRLATGLPGLGSPVPAFRDVPNAELDVDLGELGVSMDDIFGTGDGGDASSSAKGSGNTEAQDNNANTHHTSEDASAANRNNVDGDGGMDTPTDERKIHGTNYPISEDASRANYNNNDGGNGGPDVSMQEHDADANNHNNREDNPAANHNGGNETRQPTDEELLEGLRQNGIDPDSYFHNAIANLLPASGFTAAPNTDADANANNNADDDPMDLFANTNGTANTETADTEAGDTNTNTHKNSNGAEEQNGDGDDDDDMKGLTDEEKAYLNIAALSEEEKKLGREMHQMHLDAEVECQLPCRWCRELGLSWR